MRIGGRTAYRYRGLEKRHVMPPPFPLGAIPHDVYLCISATSNRNTGKEQITRWHNGPLAEIVNKARGLVAATSNASDARNFPTLFPILFADQEVQELAGTWHAPLSDVPGSKWFPQNSRIQGAEVLKGILLAASPAGVRICILFSSPGADPMPYITDWVDETLALCGSSTIAYAFP